MRRNNSRFGLILLVAIVGVVMIGGMVFLMQLLLGGGGKPALSTTETKLLTAPTDNTVITMDVRGPITAKEKHYDLHVELSASKRRMVAWKGYNQNEEIKKIELDNDSKAFKDFLLALNNARFVAKVKTEIAKNNGLCSTGQLITYGISQGDQVKFAAWTTSCGGQGDFAGNGATVIDLILKQIPGSRDAIAKVQSDLGN